ncbi:MAG: hypothetical protein C7B43_04715 [Sulfobacillus benefaciens]|uniref:Uncharacterized protein n=1 Tax=Sulfobacillus benefaciens TaxID=453960 RepID=A0A2T2X8J5_9FIRM|nr:MAG: hypothetical protein C7B43_04715 [Sulfobacillus benefaciens]
MLKAIVHWGLPIVLSSGLVGLSPGAGMAQAQVTPGVSKNITQSNSSHQKVVPVYPNSQRTQSMSITSPFSMPLIFGAANQQSSVWKVPVSYRQVENWYIRKMEDQGYHLISRALSSLNHSESETFGLLFAKGQENVDQVGINIVPITPTLTEYQYISARLSVPARPSSSLISSPSSVKSIDVSYKPWRYGHPAMSFTLTQSQQIDAVVKLLNALPVQPQELYHCAADFGQGATLTIHFNNKKTWVVKEQAACISVKMPHAPALQDPNLSLYHLLGQDAQSVSIKG